MAGERVRAEERRRGITEEVLACGAVTAADLAARYGVSLMTIHRDLELLEDRMVLRKSRGGATAVPSSVFESTVGYRRMVAKREKAAVARRAAEMIEPGSALVLDDSTTALAVVDHLHDKTPLTVITNFMPAMQRLAGASGIHLIGLGGDYSASHDSFLGLGCVDAIGALRADLAFVSVSAVFGGHAYHQEQDIVVVKRAMLAAADRPVLLIDHAKLERRALHRVASVGDFAVVVVDDGASAGQLAELSRSGANLEVAPR